MLLIVDRNQLRRVFVTPDESNLTRLLGDIFDPSSNTRLLIGGAKFRDEAIILAIAESIAQLERASKLVQLDDDADKAVDQIARELAECSACQSDDPHIIALSIVTGCRVLSTQDNALQNDYRCKDLLDSPRGFIYTSDDHFEHYKKRRNAAPNRIPRVVTRSRAGRRPN